MKPTPEMILTCPMPPNNAQDAPTIRVYLVHLLSKLWQDRENFNAKRPWGNSYWEGPVEKALIQAGYIEGTLDEDGYIEECDSPAAMQLVTEAIWTLDAKEPAT